MYDKSVVEIFKNCIDSQLSLFSEEVPVLDKINGHEYVDLGLTSGLKWATCNVGADNSYEEGSYYAWGEIETKESYDEENSVSNEKEFHDISGNENYDVARAEWGGTWRMPTKKEMTELIRECKSRIVRIGNVVGCRMTGPNGNQIFLPIAGFRIYEYDSFDYLRLFAGGYWSSTPYNRYDDYIEAYATSFNIEGELSKIFGISKECRFYGFHIRPVIK